jgi:hypothetical protein
MYMHVYLPNVISKLYYCTNCFQYAIVRLMGAAGVDWVVGFSGKVGCRPQLR